MFHGLRGVAVAGADRGLGVVYEEFGGEDKAGVNSTVWSSAQADQVLDQRLEFPQVWHRRQSRQKLFPEHFSGDCGAAICMRRTAIGVVPWTVPAVCQLGFCDIPRA